MVTAHERDELSAVFCLLLSLSLSSCQQSPLTYRTSKNETKFDYPKQETKVPEITLLFLMFSSGGCRGEFPLAAEAVVPSQPRLVTGQRGGGKNTRTMTTLLSNNLNQSRL